MYRFEQRETVRKYTDSGSGKGGAEQHGGRGCDSDTKLRRAFLVWEVMPEGGHGPRVRRQIEN